MPKRPYLDEFRRDRGLSGLIILLSEENCLLLEVVHRYLGGPEKAWGGKASLLGTADDELEHTPKMELYGFLGPTREGCVDALEKWLYHGAGSVLLSGQPALARVAGDEEWVA